MSYELHPSADAELSSGARHYAREASIKVARAFLAEFERVAELLEENQQLGTRSKAGLRVYPFRRFPYSLVYSLGVIKRPSRPTSGKLITSIGGYHARSSC